MINSAKSLPAFRFVLLAWFVLAFSPGYTLEMFQNNTNITNHPVEFHLRNSAYAYNGENGTDWEETRYTITYFENLLQPTIVFHFNPSVKFSAGAGILIPFNQEEKIIDYYPYVQSQIKFAPFTLNLGSLDPEHNFPAPIMDPLIKLTPQIRVLTKSQVPIDYENFPKGIFSHGNYEYGVQLKSKGLLNADEGELYMNWQLPDTVNHRERFDVGLIYSIDCFLPFYGGFHYWHNGGHENSHPVGITENYTAAAGLRNTNFSALYLASYFLPDRDSHPELNTFGQALYGEWNFNLFSLDFQLQGFISSQFIAPNQQFISIEGDPFYRVPLYLGLNIYKDWQIGPETIVRIGFINGTFLPYGTFYNLLKIRYDQMIKIDMDYRFVL
jgi:hypothetical protein